MSHLRLLTLALRRACRAFRAEWRRGRRSIRHQRGSRSSIPVVLSLMHDDGTHTRHLAADVMLPGVPRVGDRVRAGRAGMYLMVESVLWDDRDCATVRLAPVGDRDAHLYDLLDRGWRMASKTLSYHARATKTEKRAP